MSQHILQLKTFALLFIIAFLYNSGYKNNSTNPLATQSQFKIAYHTIRIGRILICAKCTNIKEIYL